MRLKTLSLAIGALLLSAGVASAAVVTRDLNLRSGPGTRYHVITTMPAGAHVGVLGCAGAWCRVDWRGRVGFASARYLASAGAAYIAPPPAYYSPWPYYPYYYGPGPVVRFGFSWGGHRTWRGHRNWGGHRVWRAPRSGGGHGYRGAPRVHRGGPIVHRGGPSGPRGGHPSGRHRRR